MREAARPAEPPRGSSTLSFSPLCISANCNHGTTEEVQACRPTDFIWDRQQKYARLPLWAITCHANAASHVHHRLAFGGTTVYPESKCLCVSSTTSHAGYDYPEVVRFEIEEQDLPSYLRAADFLNISDVDIVCLQHEFGIFGGPAGGHSGHAAGVEDARRDHVSYRSAGTREPTSGAPWKS